MLALRAKGDWIKIKLNPSAAHSFTLDLGRVASTDFLVWLPKTKFGLILNTKSNHCYLYGVKALSDSDIKIINETNLLYFQRMYGICDTEEFRRALHPMISY